MKIKFLLPFLLIAILVIPVAFADDEEPSFVIDAVIQDNGNVKIHFIFSNIPEPCGIGSIRYIISVNSDIYSTGVEENGMGSFGAPSSANNLMKLGGAVIGSCVSESFPQTNIVAHFGIPYLKEPTPDLYCGEPISFYQNVIHGTDGNDYLKGTSVIDLIFGYGGNDIVKQKHGNDCLVGGTGMDTFVSDDDYLPFNVESDGSDTCMNRTYRTIELC